MMVPAPPSTSVGVPQVLPSHRVKFTSSKLSSVEAMIRSESGSELSVIVLVTAKLPRSNATDSPDQVPPLQVL